MTTTTSAAAAATDTTAATTTRQRQATVDSRQATTHKCCMTPGIANEAGAPRRRQRQKGQGGGVSASHGAARCAGAQREFQCQERKLPRPERQPSGGSWQFVPTVKIM